LFAARPMDAQQPSPLDRYYRPELDVLHFVAFLLVFLYHAVPATGHRRMSELLPNLAPTLFTLISAGRFGLCVFFVLSALLLSKLLVSLTEGRRDRQQICCRWHDAAQLFRVSLLVRL
jgi:peptidoglycan/LPS O-acetylase OafA/YrhL